MPEEIDFRPFPKQWIVSARPLSTPVAGKEAVFEGCHVQAADHVPLIRVQDAQGAQAILIGWVIARGRLFAEDAEIALAPDETLAEFYEALSGRFVMLARGPKGPYARLDSSGSLGAVFHPGEGLLAATGGLIGTRVPLQPDPEVGALLDFPRRHGYLPFGLTPHKDVRRLLPGFELDLATMAPVRVWSARMEDRVGPEAVADLISEAATILKSHVGAILDAGVSTLYLSGGYDSRIVLAAARGRTDRLRTQTYGAPQGLDAHVARQVTKRADVAHEVIPVTQASDAAVRAWLDRTGHTFYHPVTDMTETVLAHAPEFFPMAGTGTEISRATVWGETELAQDEVHLASLRDNFHVPFPDCPVINDAAEAWVATLPAMDAALAMDMAKIDHVHGCWSGTEVYGHDMAIPTLHPFSSQRLLSLCLALPREYRLANGFYRDIMSILWPELMDIPINKAQGLTRLRFWREEIKKKLPAQVKAAFKPMA